MSSISFEVRYFLFQASELLSQVAVRTLKFHGRRLTSVVAGWPCRLEIAI